MTRILTGAAMAALLAACPTPEGVGVPAPASRQGGDVGLYIHMRSDDPMEGAWVGLRPSDDGTRLLVEYGDRWDALGCTVRLDGTGETGFLVVTCADGAP